MKAQRVLLTQEDCIFHDLPSNSVSDEKKLIARHLYGSGNCKLLRQSTYKPQTCSYLRLKRKESVLVHTITFQRTVWQSHAPLAINWLSGENCKQSETCVWPKHTISEWISMLLMSVPFSRYNKQPVRVSYKRTSVSLAVEAKYRSLSEIAKARIRPVLRKQATP